MWLFPQSGSQVIFKNCVKLEEEAHRVITQQRVYDYACLPSINTPASSVTELLTICPPGGCGDFPSIIQIQVLPSAFIKQILHYDGFLYLVLQTSGVAPKCQTKLQFIFRSDYNLEQMP